MTCFVLETIHHTTNEYIFLHDSPFAIMRFIAIDVCFSVRKNSHRWNLIAHD